MTDRYAVIGNPIAHSRSPSIHARFAAQTGQDLVYDRLLAPIGGFGVTVDAFRAGGGRGLNVTVPFKLDAFSYAGAVSPRARAAGAVNTLSFDGDRVEADNTDGIGLVRDLSHRLGFALRGSRVLLLGAGGAARGVILPLLEAGVAAIVVANRTEDKARQLAALAADPRVTWAGFDDTGNEPLGLFVNATSAGLSGGAPAVCERAFRGCLLAYDMVYAGEPTVFMRHAQALGCERVCDGLGMLVEQAAESFRIWRGVAPDTAPVYAVLRDEIGRG
jgi:shikimate dehydrogenase